jgi:hypothetical protein
VRISATTLESFRLFMQPDQEWMSEQSLIDTILGKFVPTPPVLLGQAFGRVLESPERYRVSAGYQYGDYFFSADMMAPAFAAIDYRGVFEAKATKAYGDCTVVAMADHLLGAHLSEFKTTLSTFDFDKYAASCQWRFMADIFEAQRITYRVFCLSEDPAGITDLKSIESFDLYPYPGLHQDCADLVAQFKAFAIAKALDGFLIDRQRAAEAA